MFAAKATSSVGRNTSLTILDSIMFFYDDVFAYFSITMKCGDERNIFYKPDSAKDIYIRKRLTLTW